MELVKGNRIKVFPRIMAWMDGTVSGSFRQLGAKNDQSKHNGCGKKKYRYSAGVRRVVRAKIASMAFQTPKGRLWFFTLTASDHIEDNRPLKCYFDNLVKRGIVKDYVWVRERQKRGANHWHVIASMGSDYVSYKVMRNAWNSALETCGYAPSINSWRGGDKNGKVLVSDWNRACNYVSKYMTKHSNEKRKVVVDEYSPEVKKQKVSYKVVDDWEDFRLTASSRIQYKGKIELNEFISMPASHKKYITNGYVGMHVFEPNHSYYAHVLTAWRVCVEVENYYTNQIFKNEN